MSCVGSVNSKAMKSHCRWVSKIMNLLCSPELNRPKLNCFLQIKNIKLELLKSYASFLEITDKRLKHKYLLMGSPHW